MRLPPQLETLLTVKDGAVNRIMVHGGGHFLERFSEDGPLERLEKGQNVGNNIPAILPVPEHPSKSEIFS